MELAGTGYQGSQAQWNSERAAHMREMREREKQFKREAVDKARAEAQSAAEELRMKRESLPTLNTAQAVTGDVELDMAVRKYQKAVDALEAAIYELGDEGGDE
jgi:hypothetical protein